MLLAIILTILTGIVYYIILLELFWLLNIKLNVGWLLGIAICSDFITFLLERTISGSSTFSFSVLFPVGLLVVIFLYFPNYLHVLFNKPCFLYLIFIVYISSTVIWSGYALYGGYKLSFLLVRFNLFKYISFFAILQLMQRRFRL
jgi:hypothetical protein